VALDNWGDRRQASVFLYALLKKYPESTYAADAQFMMDNMNEPGMVQPKSIEELRQLNQGN
jgi:hypothetical protein